MKFQCLLLLLLCNTTLLIAQQPGSLDYSFGDNGIIVNNSSLVEGETVKVTKDGRILIGTLGPHKGFAFTFRIDALLPDGSPDVSFGEEGSAYVLFPGMTKPSDNAGISSLALLPDGRIMAGGSLNATDNKNQIAFARFKSNGTVDSSFGINGTATASFGYINESAGRIILQPDGKIVSTGCVTTSIGDYIDKVFTARYMPDGTKDLDFGNNGIVVSSTIGCAAALALQQDGKIISAGYKGNMDASDARYHIERYNPDGTYDQSFGVNGVVTVQAGTGGGHINDVAIQPDGRIVVCGTSAQPFDLKFTVARFNVDGSFDKSFGENGVVATTFSQYNGDAKKVFLTGQNEDKIVVAGSNYDIFSGEGDFAVVGYNTDGSLDAEFGNNGVQLTDIGDGDYLTGSDLQTDGKIVTVGYTQSFQTFEDKRVLTRYNGYPTRVPLYVRVKRWLENHGISWKGLPAQDNIAYYSIERSNNRTTGFTQIAKVSGVNHLNNYDITNSQLLRGTNYYRIKAVSTDGAIRYSEVVSADNSAATASIYPNPVRNYVQVQGLQSNEQANISITNSNGTVLARGVSGGSTQYRTPASNLQRGTYYLNITTNSGKTETLQFVKE